MALIAMAGTRVVLGAEAYSTSNTSRMSHSGEFDSLTKCSGTQSDVGKGKDGPNMEVNCTKSVSGDSDSLSEPLSSKLC